MKNQMQKVKIKIQNNNAKSKSFLRVYGVIFLVFLFYVLRFTFYVLPVHAATGINREINFQGKLVDSSGLNVADNTYTVVFSLYNTASSGTAIWTETDSVTTKAGIFQVQLGATTPLPDTVYFNNDSLYLGIKVGSDAEMTPRIQFTAVPYALNSASLDGVVATQSATGFNLQGGTSSQSTLAFTTDGNGLHFQPGVAEGLTIESNGANGLTLDTGGAAALNIGNTNATSFIFGKAANNPSFTFNNGTSGFTIGGSGTITVSALNTALGLVYTSGTNGQLSQTAPTTGLQCLQSNALNSALAWVTCTALGTNYMQLDAGALSPFSNTADLLLGSTATGSASFAFTGVDSSTPIASIAAVLGDNNGLSLNASGSQIQSLNKNTLTLGGNTTGTILFQPNGDTTNNLQVTSNGSGIIVGTANASPLTIDTGGAAALNIGTTNANSLVLGSNNVSSITLNTSSLVLPAQSVSSSEILNNTLDFNKFATSQTLDTNHTVTLAGYNYILNLNSTGNFSIQNSGTNFAQFLNNAGTATITLGESAAASTLNLGTGTGADTIHIGDNNTTGDTLTIGNNNASTALSLTGGTSWSIGSTGNATLGSTSVTSLSGAGLANCNGSNSKVLWSSSTNQFSCGTITGGGGSDVQQANQNLTVTALGTTSTALGTVSIAPSTNTGDVWVQANLWTESTSTTNQTLTWEIYSGTSCTGTPLSSSTSDVYTYRTNANGPGGYVSALITNPGTSTQNYEICGYSNVASGATAGGVATATVIDTSPSTGGSAIAVRTSDLSTTVNPVTTLEFGPATSSTDEFTVTNEGSSIARVRIGSQVGMLNAADVVTGGWTFNTAATAFTTELDANGGINTSTPNQNLTLAANGSGNILLSADNNTSVGIGTTTPDATLDVRGQLATSPAASISAISSFAGLLVDNTIGDLFTASSSGISQFVIKNDGQVGIGTANPIAKLDVAGDASISGALTFMGNSAGTIQTTNNQTLTIGGSATGNIFIRALSQLEVKPVFDSLTGFQIENAGGSAVLTADTINSRIGIGTTAPTATLDVQGTSGTLAVATVSGQTSFASLLVNNNGVGDLFTASKSGATKFTINNSGYIVGANYSTAGGILYTDDTGTFLQTSPGLNGQCLQSTQGGAPTWGACGTGGGSSVWDSLTGVITPKIETQDLLLGGQATTSARFAFVNVNTGTPTASISATNGNALSLNANGSITTTMGQELTLGGGNSGDVYTASHLHLDPIKGINGGGLSDCSNPTTSKLLWSATTNLFSCGTDQGGSSGGSLTVAESDSSNSVSAVAELEFGPGTSSSDQFTLTNAGSGVAQITLGTQVPLLNQTETVASAWTFTNAITANNGIQTISGTNLSLAANGSGNIVLNSDADTGVYIGSSSNNPAVLSVSGGIGSNALAIFNQNNSGDLLAASASGVTKFVIKNDGTASSSAGFTINGAGIIQSTNNNLLILGSASTGNVLLFSNYQKGVFIGSANNTRAPLSVSGGIGSNALAIFNQNNLGDILTASASGQTKFRITNTGLVGVGSGTPVAALQVVGGNQGGNATMIVNQNGASANDIFAASAAGTTKFVIKNDGTASSAAGFTIDGAGAIQSTNGQTLTVGGSGTGNIIFDPNKSSNGLTMVSTGSTIAMTTSTATGLTLGTGTTGNIAIDTGTSGNISIGTGSSGNTIALGNTGTGTTLNLNSGSGGINIGDSATTNYINIGGVNNNGSDTVRISTNATSPDTILIGNTNASTSLSLVGGSNWSLSSSGVFTGTQITTNSNGNLSLMPNGTGEVGINTTTPTAELDVAGTASVGGQLTFRSGTAQIQSTANQTLTIGGSSTGNIMISPNNGSGFLAINANATTGITINGTAALSVACPSGDALNGFTTVDGIVTAGTCTVNSHDIAEEYFSSQALQPGDVVATDPTATQAAMVQKTISAYEHNTLGVVSTHPQTVLGGNDGGYPIALVGRIPVKVTLDGGSIAIGDYITSSSTQGFGMKATVAGNTIGTALESTSNWNEADCPVVPSINAIVWPADDGNNAAHPCFRIITSDGHTQYVGKIMMFASLSYANPEVSVPSDGNYDLLQNSDLSVFDQSNNTASTSSVLNTFYTIKTGTGIALTSTAAFAKATIANIRAGAVIAKAISTDQLNVTTGNIMLGGQTIHDYISGIVKQVLSESNQTTSTAVAVNGLITATQSAQLVQAMLNQKDLSATVSGMTVTGVLGADTINTKHIAGLTDLSAATITAASISAQTVMLDTANIKHIAGLTDLTATTVSVASISAQTITADTINAKHISGLDVLTTGLQKDDARITALENLVATPSAVPTIAQEPTISQTYGITPLSNTSGPSTVSGDLRVKGNGLIEGILHVADSLFANNFIANGVADFFGNVIFHSGVTFEKTPTFTSDTAGIAVIKKGADHVDVKFSTAYDQEPIINASITTVSLTPTPNETPAQLQQRQDEMEKTLLADNIHFIITNKTVNGFTILLDQPAEEDISFSWLALAVQNPVIFQSDGTKSQSPTPTDELSPSPIDTIKPTSVASTSAGL